MASDAKKGFVKRALLGCIAATAIIVVLTITYSGRGKNEKSETYPDFFELQQDSEGEHSEPSWLAVQEGDTQTVQEEEGEENHFDDAEAPPPPSIPRQTVRPAHGTMPIAEKEFIFEEGSQVRSVHASTLVPTADWGILAAWFGGSMEGASDTGIWVARRPPTENRRDPGRWTEPQLAAKSSDEAHWNPVLFKPEAFGRDVWLFYKVGMYIPEWRTYVTRSMDDGHTWQFPTELVPGDTMGGRGPVKNKPLRLSSGAWLAGASTEKGRWIPYVDISADWGRTWTVSDFIKEGNYEAIQPTLFETAPGQVSMFLRSKNSLVLRSDSADDGRTWAPLYPTTLPNNNSGLDVARLRDGTLVLAYNPVAGDWAERYPLRLSVSYDHGRTWPCSIDIETEEGEYSYPAIIPWPTPWTRHSSSSGIYTEQERQYFNVDLGYEDGFALTYTHNRNRIAFVSMTLAEVVKKCENVQVD